VFSAFAKADIPCSVNEDCAPHKCALVAQKSISRHKNRAKAYSSTEFDRHPGCGWKSAYWLRQGHRARFVEVVETEIMNLHEGNIARYRLRPSEYESWMDRWR
jgi:hypothetical protein